MSAGQAAGLQSAGDGMAVSLETPQWYALRTRSRHEKMVAEQLQQQGIENYLPLVKRKRKWSDRVKEVELPLFSGYAFVKMAILSPDRVRVLQTHGVAGIVGVRGAGVAIPEVQIESLKTVLAHDVPFDEYPYLSVGQKVRVRGGSLDGVEGILEHKDQRTLVISVASIHRSLSIRVDGYCVEAI